LWCACALGLSSDLRATIASFCSGCILRHVPASRAAVTLLGRLLAQRRRPRRGANTCLQEIVGFGAVGEGFMYDPALTRWSAASIVARELSGSRYIAIAATRSWWSLVCRHAACCARTALSRPDNAASPPGTGRPHTLVEPCRQLAQPKGCISRSACLTTMTEVQLKC
jgi:hypothetical protein